MKKLVTMLLLFAAILTMVMVSCKEEVPPPTILVESITLNIESITLAVGDTETLTATVTPENATDKIVTWQSSDTSVVTVENGNVTAVKTGNATITAMAGEKSATCSVKVHPEVTSIEITINDGKSVIRYTDETQIENTLRNEITVTATYDDESSAIVTDYTVTINNENTVATITYGGFSGVVTLELAPAVTFYYGDYEGAPESFTSFCDDNGKVTPPEDPTRMGYEFAGWIKEDGSSIDFSNASFTENANVAAKWEPITVSVSLDLDGGTSEDTSPLTATTGTVLSVQDPIKTGYTFVGWFTDEANETEYDMENTIFTDDFTLHAKWKANVYTITFDSDNGSAVEIMEIEYGDYIVIPDDPVRDGYVFAGWFVDGNLYDFSSPVTSNLNLKATWNKILSVFVHVNGEIVKTIQMEAGKVLSEDMLEDISFPENLELIQWSTTEEGEDSYDFSVPLVDDIDIYAILDVKMLTVTFMYSDSYVLFTENIEYGSSVEKPKNPDLSPDYFKHWSLSPDGEPFDFTSAITHDITLHCVIFEDPVIVHYYNAESISAKSIVIENGDSIPSSFFESSMWATDVNFNGTPYSQGSPITRDITLYEIKYERKDDGGIALTDVSYEFKSFVVPLGVTEISNKAFNLVPIKSIEIPETVTRIGDYSFEDSALESIIIPDSVESLGIYVFKSCDNLTTVSLPNHLTEIPEGLFQDCTSLSFYGIDSFSGEFLLLSENVEKIGAHAFENCKSLTSSDYFYGSPYSNFSNIKEIGDYSFAGADLGSEITNWENLIVIGDYAFAGATGFPQFPAEMDVIGAHAFDGFYYEGYNYDLVSITAGSIGDYAFVNSTFPSQLNLTVSGEIGIGLFEGSKLYHVTANFDTLPADTFKNSIVNNEYSSDEGGIILPNVQIIGECAFEGATITGNVDLGSATTICDRAFANADLDGSLDLRGIKSIPAGVFEGLKTVGGFSRCIFDFSGAEYISSETFSDINIDTGVIDFNVIIRGDVEFGFEENGDGLFGKEFEGNIVIADDSDSISDGLFKNLNTYYQIQIPETVTRIGNHAFENCSISYINGIIFNITPLYIGDYAFKNCTVDCVSGIDFSAAEYIGDYAVSEIQMESSFPSISIVLNDSVVLGTGAFSKNAGSYDYAIENLTLSSDLTHYTKNVFEGSSIRDLRISVGSESLKIGEEAFKNTSIYNCWIEDGITAIGAGAFEWDSTSSITYMEGASFRLPDTIVEIGDRAFAGVTGSFTITLPEQLEIIGNAAFEGCSFLSLDGAFSPALRIIGDGAFRNTRAMSPSILTFNEGLEKIGDEAFANTSVWDNVRLVIPSTVKSIGTNAFNDFFYYSYDGQSVQILSKTLNAFSPGYPWGFDSDISIIWGENEIV